MILWGEVIRYLENERTKCDRAIKSWGHDAYGRPKLAPVTQLEQMQSRRMDIEDTLHMIENEKFMAERRA